MLIVDTKMQVVTLISITQFITTFVKFLVFTTTSLVVNIRHQNITGSDTDTFILIRKGLGSAQTIHLNLSNVINRLQSCSSQPQTVRHHRY